MRGKKLVALVASTALISGCVTTGHDSGPMKSENACEYDTTTYIAAGAVAGAVLGLIIGGKKNRAAGALIGTAVGGIAGKATQSYLESRCRRLAEAKKQLKVATVETEQIQVPRLDHAPEGNMQGTGQEVETSPAIKLNISIESMFASGSSSLSREAREDFRTLAKTFADTDRKVLIVGHTDSTGDDRTNQQLSEERAKTVALLFQEEGIPVHSLYFKGAGASQPVASNDTVEGRAKNRRVEVIELEDEASVLTYAQLSTSNPESLPLSAPPRSDVAEKDNENSKQTKPSSQPPTFAKALRQDHSLDFGGKPVDQTGADIASLVGAEKDSGGLLGNVSIFSKAFASDDLSENPLLTTSCIADSYREQGEVKSLSTGTSTRRSIGDYAPGLYSTSWSEKLNSHLVAMTHVAVSRDGDTDPGTPDVFVFANFKPGQEKPTIEAVGKPRTYMGEAGILYRVFMSKEAWPIRCIDLVFDQKSPEKAAYGRLYYDKDGKVYAASYMPTLVRSGS
ncbi:OmpA family protein [Aestuariispira ectoiniformans]|uniref:OmpA family protein n=1 Tax=Aestuariispira ectoiniformans TaxID=2775080 RepID=UPI00223B7B19|nr:OmpA family protein [Aestuariispira ectoiniformans]